MKRLSSKKVNYVSIYSILLKKRSYRFFGIFLILALNGIRLIAQEPKNFIIPAAQRWVDIKIELKQGQKVTISSRGEWTNGGGNPQQVGPSGFEGVLLNSTIAPKIPLGALIGRVNNGPTFVIGEGVTYTSPLDGFLFLSMNDDDFSDNKGQLRVSVEVKPWILMTAKEFVRPKFFVLTEEQIRTWMSIFFSGGRVQLSQTETGTPVTITTGGISKKCMSFVTFGPLLNGFGVDDIPIDLPIKEFTLDNIRNSGGFSVFGQYLLTHGLLFVDRFHFLVNNIHAIFDNDLEFSIKKNEVLLQLTLHAPDPAIRGEGNGYHPLFGLFPIPLGWRDGLCPDIAIDKLKISIHLSPFLDGNNKLKLNDPTVSIVEGKLSISILDWLPLAEEIKNNAMEDFRSSLEKELRKDKAKKGLESGILSLFPILTGNANNNISSIDLNEGAITIFYNK
jgi:hypothetical protein